MRVLTLPDQRRTASARMVKGDLDTAVAVFITTSKGALGMTCSRSLYRSVCQSLSNPPSGGGLHLAGWCGSLRMREVCSPRRRADGIGCNAASSATTQLRTPARSLSRRISVSVPTQMFTRPRARGVCLTERMCKSRAYSRSNKGLSGRLEVSQGGLQIRLPSPYGTDIEAAGKRGRCSGASRTIETNSPTRLRTDREHLPGRVRGSGRLKSGSSGQGGRIHVTERCAPALVEVGNWIPVS